MSHEFGNINSWTKDKLDRVQDYLNAYLTALKNQNFHLTYIDAFAGTGYVNMPFIAPQEGLFDFESTVTLKEFIDGSARIALQTDPSFANYIFIEQDKKRCEELEKLKLEFPALANSISIINGEANAHVQKLCEMNWIYRRSRGVMFLDPYGTQVSWETIKAIANTQAIDLWLLFPIGTVNRLLNRNGKIKEGRKYSLNRLFGDDLWFDTFFDRQTRHSLFSDESETLFVKKASFEAIADYFVSKLKSVFADAVSRPLVLTNSNNSPIFLLCFAAGNPRGAPIAVKIAQHILGKK